MKVYVVICYDDGEFFDVRAFSTLEKAKKYDEKFCKGDICNYAEIEEIEVE